MANVNRRALRVTLIFTGIALLLVGVVLFAALSFARQLEESITADIQTLADITDEDLTSGANRFLTRNWVFTSRGGASFSLRWGSMTGWNALAYFNPSESTDIGLTYTVNDPGEGFRLVLVLPDDTILELTEGQNAFHLPAGETRVVLAACRTAGDFTLTRDYGPTLRTYDED